MNDNFIPWFLMIIVPALLWLVLVISALWNISRNNMSSSVKILWYIIIIFAPFIGSIIYWAWGKNKQF